MRKQAIFTVVLICVLGTMSFAQQIGYSYQTLISRQNPGLGVDVQEILKDYPVKVRFTLRAESEDGAIHYQEEHETTTNPFGILNVTVGSGFKRVGDELQSLDWAGEMYYLQVEIDLNDGEGYILMSSEPILVPPHAKQRDQELELNGSILSLSGDPGTSIDLGPVIGQEGVNGDELQTLEAGDAPGELSISEKNTVVINVDDQDADPQNENQTVTAGTGITVNQDGQDFEISNTAPDQTVTLIDGGAGNVIVGGTYPDFTIDVPLVEDNDADPTNEIQDLQLTGNTLSITNNTSATSIDLSSYVGTNIQLTEVEVDAYVSNNGYLTEEVDGSITNEIQDISLSGTNLSISDGSTIDLSVIDTNTQLTEEEVDAMVSDNGYLTSFTEVDGSTSNEIQDLSTTGAAGNIAISDGSTLNLNVDDADASTTNEIQDISLLGANLSISDGSTIDLSVIDTNTQLTESEVDAMVSDNGYLTSFTEVDGSTSNEIQDLSTTGTAGNITISDGSTLNLNVDDADASATNEIQDISLLGTDLSISDGSTIDLSVIDTNTQLTEAEVDAYVSNNGYLTEEIDGSISNELQTISRTNDEVTLSNSGGSFSIADDDADPENELQDLTLTGTILSISDDPDGDDVDLSGFVSPFEENDGVIAATNIGADFIVGSTSTDDLPGFEDNSRMFFDKNQSAFRVGYTTAEQWNAANLGYASFAAGYLPTASGLFSIAIGRESIANNNDAIALGRNSNALNHDAVAIGRGSTATEINALAVSGGTANSVSSISIGGGSEAQGGGAVAIGRNSFSSGSLAIGNDANASGLFSNALGHESTSSGDRSLAIGEAEASGDFSIAIGLNAEASLASDLAMGTNATANGGSSVALGYNSSATGVSAVALGQNSTASGSASTSIGVHTVARSGGEVVLGYRNTDYTPINTVLQLQNNPGTDRLFVIGNGDFVGTRSNALVMLKNGNTTLNGSLTIDADNVGGEEGYTLPAQDGDENQVMVTDGAGELSWESPGQSPLVLDEANNIIHNRNPEDEDFVFGSPQLGDDGDPDHDRRMFFDKSNGALRAGHVSGVQWDNRGQFSTAFGSNTSAMGTASFAAGHNSQANGQNSIALGATSEANGGDSFAAIGARAHDDWSIALGVNADAYAVTSVAIGFDAGAYEQHAIAIGDHVNARSSNETALGLYNTDYITADNLTDRLLVVGNGIDDSNRSDAFVMLKNGNTTANGDWNIAGELVANSLGVAGQFDLPTTDGISGQALVTDGTGNIEWGVAPAASAVFTNLGSVISPTLGNLAADDFVIGSSQLADDDGTSDDDSRMFFDKSKGAFRAGTLGAGNLDYWDDENVGNYSVAMGEGVRAAGNQSVAIGSGVADGNQSVSLGSAFAQDHFAVAIGNGAVASDSYSLAIGDGISSGNRSIAIGNGVVASGDYTTALGNTSVALGDRSSAFGSFLFARSYGETALGIRNTTYVENSTESFDPSDRLLVVGNGPGVGNTSDALVILKNGNTEINGEVTIDPANDDTGYTLPVADGSNGQVMMTNGGGQVSWAPAPVGAGFTHRLGEEYLGGIIYYLYIGTDGLEHGLVVHPEEASHPWSTTNTVYGADRSWDGAYNTSQMDVLESPAKAYVEGLGVGWYIPSLDEIRLLSSAKFHVNRTLYSEGYSIVTNDEYLSSTEYNAANVYTLSYRVGIGSKGIPSSVRAIRSF